MPFSRSHQPSPGSLSSDPEVKIITPLKVRGRSGQPEAPRRMPGPAVTLLLLLIAVLAAIAAGGLLFTRHVSKHAPGPAENRDPASSSASSAAVKPAPDAANTARGQTSPAATPLSVPSEQPPAAGYRQPIDPATSALEKEKAEKELAAFFKLKASLDQRGVSTWGGQAYEQMVNLGREGDALLTDKAFVAAAEKYAQAAQIASRLTDNIEPAFQRFLAAGRTALEDGNITLARENFRTALIMAPSSQTAKMYLERAEKLDKANRMLISGQNHEKNNRFAFALADYQHALKLDPQSKSAQKALSRIKERIADRQFQKLMSDGLTAYHSGDYQSALTKLRKAKSFQPGSHEVQEALAQVDAAIRLDKIEKLRRQATAAEQSEKWEQALKSYLTVLNIDPDISFALQGKQRALEHIRVAKRIGFFLQKPEALESNQQLQNAALLIEEGQMLQPLGPRRQGQLDKLKILVAAYQTPVKVTVVSDNLTEVVVYKVGKLGRFTLRELALRPGKYTAVGSRNGYKDVRKTIIVKPGRKALRATVICTEKIAP